MIKKIRLMTLLLSFSLLGFGQELPYEKSENHIQIEGTNIFIVPPASFESSINFNGFQNPYDQASMIMVTEIPGPYSEVTKGFNSKTMRKQGMELKAKKEIKVGHFDGLLIELDQPAYGKIFSKQIIAYGDENGSTIINGIYLKDSVQLGEKIKESILTTYVDSKTESNPREALDYTIDESVGSLKFKAVIGNGMLLNRDLKTPTESVDKATLVTGKSFAKVEINNEKSFSISRLKQYPGDYSVITDKGFNVVKIDNLKGLELFAKNNDKEDEEMYQVILFDENGGYYIFVGTYVTGSEEAISDIKNVIQTFKRKNN